MKICEKIVRCNFWHWKNETTGIKNEEAVIRFLASFYLQVFTVSVS